MGSIANKTELWRLAAVIMGETPAKAITDATTPTTPLEKTFDEIYNVVRRKMFLKAKPDWAVQSRVLREAPTVDWAGTVNDWGRHGDAFGYGFVYAPPVGSLDFLGFRRDNGAGLVKYPYVRKSLPIRYGIMPYTGAAVASVVSPDSAFPAHLYREWMHGSFHDAHTDRFIVTDVHRTDFAKGTFIASKTDQFNATIIDYLMGDVFTPEIDYALGGSTATMDWTLVIAGEGQVSAELPVYMEYAYGNPYAPVIYDGQTEDADSTHSRHIYCDVHDAIGEFVIDVQNIPTWEDSFSELVAAELARRGAIVHAKSTKLIAKVEQERQLSLNDAVADSWSDDAGGNTVVSSTEQARQ